MHPVPSFENLQWLRGDRLDRISTAEFTIWFAFDSTGIIQADDVVELKGKGGKSELYNPQTREGNWLFHNIVGRIVEDVIRPDDWTIEIIFQNRFQLIVRSNDGPYESGRVVLPVDDAQSSHFF